MMFRRHAEAQCYFCNTLVLPVPWDSRNFRCPSCACWNRYDSKGEIVGDEPAMHEESLNAKSFSKRASPSKDRLPTTYGSGPFCRDCTTNQQLILNLLANYLPSPTSPDYEERLAMLPEYRESLHARYPPVCNTCLPAVEDEIRRKDAMARAQALGGWLKETKGKARQRRVSATAQEREKLLKELLAWRIRGFLWGVSLISFIIGYSVVLLDLRPFHRLSLLKPVLPAFVLFSVLWTAWDPTYASMRTAQLQGRDVRVQGKRNHNVLQMIIWVSRLVTASLLALQWFNRDYLHISRRPLNLLAQLYFIFSLGLEICLSIASFSILRIQQPPTIRLINTKTYDLGSSRSPTPNPGTEPSSRAGTPSFPSKISEPDHFASLTLSSQPVVQKNSPVFGLPSLLASVPPPSRPEESNEDEMDWSPTDPNSNPKRLRHTDDDGSWLRPQRFFVPEKPTGLESLFEKTRLADDVSMKDGTGSSGSLPLHSRRQPGITHIKAWYWIYAAVLVLLLGIYLKLHIDYAPIQQAVTPSEDIDDPIRQSGVYRHMSRSSSAVPQ